MGITVEVRQLGGKLPANQILFTVHVAYEYLIKSRPRMKYIIPTDNIIVLD